MNDESTNDGAVRCGWSRRQIFRAARLWAWGHSCQVRPTRPTRRNRARAVGAPVTPPSGRDLYTSLGVRPIINARGTLTIIGGSMELPEVRAAKAAANQLYVNLEELMEAAGARLANSPAPSGAW